MIEATEQIDLQAYVLAARLDRTDKTAAGIGEEASGAVSARDRYLPYTGEVDSGVYTPESLSQNFALSSAEDLDEDGIDSRIFEQDEKDASAVKNPNELDEGDKEMVKRLQARDQEVRLHEQSHAAAAGQYAMSAPSYHYQRGPDGKMYAIGGEVAVDVGKEASQAENNVKAIMLRGAAMGVADPSGADAMVAAEAGRLMGRGVNLQA